MVADIRKFTSLGFKVEATISFQKKASEADRKAFIAKMPKGVKVVVKR